MYNCSQAGLNAHCDHQQNRHIPLQQALKIFAMPDISFYTKNSAVISLSCKTPNKVKMLITELRVKAVCRLLLSQPVNFAFEACWC